MALVTRETRKDLYLGFWIKAQRFLQLMERADADGNLNGAALAAIHCAISTVDALTVYKLGLRSAGQRHEDAATLLEKTHLADCQAKARKFRHVLSLKTLVEYEPILPSETQAQLILHETQWLYEWAKLHLPQSD